MFFKKLTSMEKPVAENSGIRCEKTLQELNKSDTIKFVLTQIQLQKKNVHELKSLPYLTTIEKGDFPLTRIVGENKEKRLVINIDSDLRLQNDNRGLMSVERVTFEDYYVMCSIDLNEIDFKSLTSNIFHLFQYGSLFVRCKIQYKNPQDGNIGYYDPDKGYNQLAITSFEITPHINMVFPEE